jgi:hypothetical protein
LRKLQDLKFRELNPHLLRVENANFYKFQDLKFRELNPHLLRVENANFYNFQDLKFYNVQKMQKSNIIPPKNCKFKKKYRNPTTSKISVTSIKFKKDRMFQH